MTTTIRRRVGLSRLLLVCGLVCTPSVSLAQGEVTAVVGGFLGGDLNNILSGNASVESAFENGPLYGVRLGWVGGIFGIEGSFVSSPSGLALSLPNRPLGVNGTVYSLEGNVLFLPIPGPISPFVTAGVGWHSYSFDIEGETQRAPVDEIQKMGFNVGGGLKINIAALTVRFDVRDHITSIGPDDFNVASIASELGIGDDAALHNVEISAGFGFRF